MPSPARSLNLQLLPQEFAIVRLSPESALPSWASQGSFFSITRTLEELSLIAEADRVPRDLPSSFGWRILKVAGPFAFSEVGVLASLAAPLASADVSIFAVSTYDTDYVLLQTDNLPAAMETLKNAGHKITGADF